MFLDFLFPTLFMPLFFSMGAFFFSRSFMNRFWQTTAHFKGFSMARQLYECITKIILDYRGFWIIEVPDSRGLTVYIYKYIIILLQILGSFR